MRGFPLRHTGVMPESEPLRARQWTQDKYFPVIVVSPHHATTLSLSVNTITNVIPLLPLSCLT